MVSEGWRWVAGGSRSLRGEIGKAGEGGDEFLRVGVLGGAEDLGRGAAFDDFAFVQNGDAMAKSRDREQIVRDIENAHAKFAVEAGEETEDFGLRDGVAGAGGFNGDEKPRAMEDGHGDDDALGLADTKLRGAAAKKVVVAGEAHASECRADGGSAFFARAGGMSAPGFAELRADAQSGIEGS